MSYCAYIRSLSGTRQALHQRYHDQQYGFPMSDDNALFGRLLLEINQAGLSWELILKKEAAFEIAYAHFDIDAVAAFDEADRRRLLSDPGIIRNRLKVNAAIENARRLQQIRSTHGSFKGWLDAYHPLSKEAWVKLFKQHFKFTGGEIVHEFLMSTGYLPGAHDPDCPILEQIRAKQPKWLRSSMLENQFYESEELEAIAAKLAAFELEKK